LTDQRDPSVCADDPWRAAGQVRRGRLRLRNQPPGTTARTVSGTRTVAVEQVRPELTGISPSAASLGQYVEMQGAGFIGGQAGQATLVRLQGQFSLQGSPVMIPVDTEIVVKWLPRYSGAGWSLCA
jgi:hypothetical protein